MKSFANLLFTAAILSSKSQKLVEGEICPAKEITQHTTFALLLLWYTNSIFHYYLIPYKSRTISPITICFSNLLRFMYLVHKLFSWCKSPTSFTCFDRYGQNLNKKYLGKHNKVHVSEIQNIEFSFFHSQICREQQKCLKS